MLDDPGVRGKLAAGIAGAAIVLVGVAVVQAAVFALSGAYLLIVAPLVGLPIAIGVYSALHRICTTADRRAEVAVTAGILSFVARAILGISFGGSSLLVPAMLLALAAACTPRTAKPAVGC